MGELMFRRRYIAACLQIHFSASISRKNRDLHLLSILGYVVIKIKVLVNELTVIMTVNSFTL